MLHGLENYELERLLASLALRNRGGGGGRRNRAQRQSARLAIRSNLASGSSPNIAPAGTTDSLDAHMAASAVAREQRDSGASGAGPAGTPESRSGLGGGRARDAFPASWPPAGTLHMQYEVRSLPEYRAAESVRGCYVPLCTLMLVCASSCPYAETDRFLADRNTRVSQYYSNVDSVGCHGEAASCEIAEGWELQDSDTHIHIPKCLTCSTRLLLR